MAAAQGREGKQVSRIWTRIRFEPVVVTNAIVAVGLLLGYELATDSVAGGVNQAFAAWAFLSPLVGAFIARTRTRSKASLELE